MRNSGSYQLVSKHSILSAQRKNKVAATEEFLEKRALHSKPEWKEELDKIKQQLQQRTREDGGCRWRRDHTPCDELSETDFGIYLDMKLEWLQQFYVTANSSKPENKIKELEEEGWNEEFEVDLKSQNSETYSELMNQEPAMEIRAEGLENRMDAVELRVGRIAKSLEQLKAMMAELKDLERKKMKPTPMEEQREEGWNENSENGWKFQKLDVIVNHEDQKYQNGGEAPTSYCAITTTETMHFHNTTEECNLDAGKKETRPKGAEMDGGEQESSDETMTEGSPKELLTEEQPPKPPKPPDGGMFKDGGSLGVVKRKGGVKERR